MTSKSKVPDARETFFQMARAASLRSRLLITLGLILFVRLGVRVPIPGIDRIAFSQAIQGGQQSPVTGLFNFLSGGGLLALGIFALGILPFINASIIVQLLTSAVPSLERLQKFEGEAGRRKISQITRYLAFASAIANSVGIALWVNRYAYSPGAFFIIQVIVALTAGSMFVVWVSELITERGIGNGASLLIFTNIVSVLPRTLGNTLNFAQSGDRGAVLRVALLMTVFLVMIVGIVFVQEATRRIPIVSARRQVGKRLYRERTTYLPLKLNQGGVLPIIFASTVLILPSWLSSARPLAPSEEGSMLTAVYELISRLAGYVSPGGSTPLIYIVAYFLLILFFSYFYTSLVVNPVDMSQNLKKMGSSIPGMRPGKATSDYLSSIMNRLTFLGALFLGFIAIVPTAVERITGITTFQGIGATSFLILVGVAIETARQVQSNVISQRYEGMVKR